MNKNITRSKSPRKLEVQLLQLLAFLIELLLKKAFFPSVCVCIYILNKNLTFMYVYRTRIRHKTILVVCCLHHIRQNVTLFCVHIGALLALSQCTLLRVVGTLCFCWCSAFRRPKKIRICCRATTTNRRLRYCYVMLW